MLTLKIIEFGGLGLFDFFLLLNAFFKLVSLFGDGPFKTLSFLHQCLLLALD